MARVIPEVPGLSKYDRISPAFAIGRDDSSPQTRDPDSIICISNDVEAGICAGLEQKKNQRKVYEKLPSDHLQMLSELHSDCQGI